MVSGGDVIREARKWLGVRWRHAGRNEHGIDCVGLGVVVTKALGIVSYDVKSYSREPNDRLLAHFYKVADEVSLPMVKEGDFLVIKDGPYPFHVAFYSMLNGMPHIIHANARQRLVIEEPYDHEWPRLTTHAFRLKGVK